MRAALHCFHAQGSLPPSAVSVGSNVRTPTQNPGSKGSEGVKEKAVKGHRKTATSQGKG